MNDDYWWNRMYGEDINTTWGRDHPDMILSELVRDSAAALGKKELHIVDIGCGNGQNSKIADMLTNHSVTYIGLDFAEEAVSYCNRTYKHSFFRHDVTLPLDDFEEQFDIIIDSGCFHAIPPEKRAGYIHNIRHISAKGAYLFLGCWYKKDKEQDIIKPAFSFFPTAPISEWFFNESDIEKLFGSHFRLTKSIFDQKGRNNLNDGFLYNILEKR